MSSSISVTFVGEYASVGTWVLKEQLMERLPKGTNVTDIKVRNDIDNIYRDLAIEIAAEFMEGHYGWDVRSIAFDIEVEEGQ